MSLDELSLKNLQGVHPDLVRVVELAAEKETFIVTEGLRNLDRQKRLVKAGKSWTLNSRHLTGHAVDLCDPDGRYDIPDMDHIRDAMFAAAAECGVPLEWGGDWKQKDTPHFQLPFKSYPASGISPAQKAKEIAAKVATSRPVLTVASGAAATVATSETAEKTPALPAIPPPPDLSAYSAWKGFGETVSGLWTWTEAHPAIAAALVLWIAGTIYWPKMKGWVTPWRPA